MDATNPDGAIQKERPVVTKPEVSSALVAYTGWENTFFHYWRSHIGTGGQWVLSWHGNVQTRETIERMPAYDAGYLLDKLPKVITIDNHEYFLHIDTVHDDPALAYEAYYMDENDRVKHVAQGENLTETLAVLIVQLIQEGVMFSNMEVS